MIAGLAFASPFAYGQYTIWDADDPWDDDSILNALFLSVTPKVSIGDVRNSLDFNLGVPIADVRSKEEYDQEHIPGSVLIPGPRILTDFPKAFPEKNIKIYIYASNNQSAGVAVRLLRNMGYSAYYIINGLSAWQRAGFQTEKTHSLYF